MSQQSETFLPIVTPSTDLDTILAIQSTLKVPRFTSDDAFTLGCLLRERLTPNPRPLLISIRAPSPVAEPRILFQTCTHPGTTADNEVWVARKTKLVLRFGFSSHYMSAKFDRDEKAFAEKFGLSDADAATYAIHGGAVPVMVEGVEGIVAVVVVSGLKQEQDHAVVVDVMEKWVKTF